MDRVKVSIGRTYNIGNYESLRLDVGIEEDCEPESLESVFDSCAFWAQVRLRELERKHLGKERS